MGLFCEIRCHRCGRAHRGRREFSRSHRRYAFRCASCGATTEFTSADLRWTFEPSSVQAREAVKAAEAPQDMASIPASELKEMSTSALGRLLRARQPRELSSSVSLSGGVIALSSADMIFSR